MSDPAGHRAGAGSDIGVASRSVSTLSDRSRSCRRGQRTLRALRTQCLAYFHTEGVSDNGAEAINLIIEKTTASTNPGEL